MNKQEFLTQMRRELTGKIDSKKLADNIAYYEDYFAECIARGEQECEIINRLGSPTLISLSIIEAYKAGIRENNSMEDDNPEYEEQEYEQSEVKQPFWVRHPRVVLGLIGIVIAIIIILLIILFFSIFIYLLPVIAIVILTIIGIQIIRSKR